MVVVLPFSKGKTLAYLERLMFHHKHLPVLICKKNGTGKRRQIMTETIYEPRAQNGQAILKNGQAKPIDASDNSKCYRAALDIKGLPVQHLPYATKLSFAPLLRHWQQKLDSPDVAERLMAREILGRVEAAPELWQPFDEYSQLAPYQEILDLLMAGLFPLSLRGTQMGKASKPFDMQAFFLTPVLADMMCGCSSIKVKMDKQGEQFFNTLVTKVCATILNACYGQKLDVDPLVIFTVEQEGRDVQYHYKSLLDIQFIEVVQKKPLKPLSQDTINHLLSNIYDLDAWMEALPPDHFELHGVVGMNLVDVTKEETISRLRYHLLEKDAVTKTSNILRLEQLLRSYFDIPGLRFGIVALDYPNDKYNGFKYSIRHCLLPEHRTCFGHETANSIYDKALRFRELLLIEDLEKLTAKTDIEHDLIQNGFRSYLVAPLISKGDKVIGMIEIGTPHPFELNSFTEEEFKQMLPLFNMAVERSREETDNQIEAIVRAQFTAIHPSVEWRFMEAAFNYLDKYEAEGKLATVEEIAFEDVYPLYAQADIVSSSSTRNQAILEDFLKNLQLIKDILSVAAQRVDFPLLDHYLLETAHRMEELKKELKSSDESMIIDFIMSEIHPLLEEAARMDPKVLQAFNIYKSQLDPHFGVVYQKRKDYEESVTRINSAISDYLEIEDERTQKMIPHYFEKYKTDGVQFELYTGQSILRQGQFSQLHLRNLRLWQLVAMVDITRKMAKLKDELPMPLQTAQLVFVYGQPISIQFRPDDKRFDVDGAYNIRYEIIKKRIDKATVSTPDGTTERLTQAGKIAIVYASEKDREEYMNYLAYLLRQDCIEEAIEELELGQLQGVQGLKALRVTVK
jgi:hypothetical protein